MSPATLEAHGTPVVPQWHPSGTPVAPSSLLGSCQAAEPWSVSLPAGDGRSSLLLAHGPCCWPRPRRLLRTVPLRSSSPAM